MQESEEKLRAELERKRAECRRLKESAEESACDDIIFDNIASEDALPATLAYNFTVF